MNWKRLAINVALAILSVCIVFGGAELLVRIFNPKKLLTYYDSQTKEKLGWPVPKKKPDEYRIFLFGESAAYGFPVSDRYSISKWLEKDFSYLLPEKRVRVINCGWVGKSSHEISEGGRLVTKYQPDLFVFYAGNNEAFTSNRLFLDNHLYHLNLILYYRSYFYRWIEVRINRLRKHLLYGHSGHVEKEYRNETIANIVYKQANVTDLEYERILKRYHDNMTGVVKYAKKKGVDVLFITLPSNVRDIRPLLSEHRTDLKESELNKWNQFYSAGKNLQEKGEMAEALSFYEKAAAIDSHYAELQFRLGQVCEKMGKFGEAKQAYIRTRDFDRQPWRATTKINEAIRKIAESEGVMFVDIVRLFETKSAHGIVSSDLVFDNVHPSITGQQLIADAIAKALDEHHKISTEKWQWSNLEKSRANYPAEWRVDGALTAYKPILTGVISWEGKHYEDAVAELEAGLSLMPDFIEIYAFLGDSYWHIGQREKAAQVFQKFKEKNSAVFEFMMKKYPDVQQVYSEATKIRQSPV